MLLELSEPEIVELLTPVDVAEGERVLRALVQTSHALLDKHREGAMASASEPQRALTGGEPEPDATEATPPILDATLNGRSVASHVASSRRRTRTDPVTNPLLTPSEAAREPPVAALLASTPSASEPSIACKEVPLVRVKEQGAGKAAACYQCGHVTFDALACIESQRWLCNKVSMDDPRQSKRSCIIEHLVTEGYKAVQTHSLSRWGSHKIRCSVTQNENIFQLGVVLQDTCTFVVVSRQAATAHCPGLTWHPLVQREEGEPLSLPRWFAPATSQGVTAEVKLAAARRARRELPVPCPLRYGSTLQHYLTLSPLVALVAAEDRRAARDYSAEGVAVKWDVGVQLEPVVLFEHDASARDSLAVDDRVVISLEAVGCHLRGIATSVKEGIVKVSILDGVSSIDRGYTVGYTVRKERIAVSFDRIQSALISFALDESCVGLSLRASLLDPRGAVQTFLRCRLPAVAQHANPVLAAKAANQALVPPGHKPVNDKQREAIISSLTQTITLVEGPPGTGKTRTASLCIYHMIQQGRGRVLVVAASNVAVNNLANALHVLGVRVIRYFPSSRDESYAAGLAAETLIDKWVRAGSELHDLQQLRAQETLSVDDRASLKRLQRKLYKEALTEVDVICCTCSAAGDAPIAGLRFHYVLADEAAQAIEPELFVAIRNGAQQLTLVGDTKQLRPIVLSKVARNAGLQVSLFERLRSAGAKYTMLDTQYRMHPAISQLPSTVFYDRLLGDGPDSATLALARARADVSFPWVDEMQPTFFWHHRSGQGSERGGGERGDSIYNEPEAVASVAAVAAFLAGSASPAEIVVISMYEAQTRRVRALLREHMPQHTIEAANVDALQGHERPFVILSLVRSNARKTVGFLDDPRRACVALTRAQSGLVIIGDALTVGGHQPWQQLVQSYSDRHLLVEGDLFDLRQCSLPATASGEQTGVATVHAFTLLHSEHERSSCFECEADATAPYKADCAESWVAYLRDVEEDPTTEHDDALHVREVCAVGLSSPQGEQRHFSQKAVARIRLLQYRLRARLLGRINSRDTVTYWRLANSSAGGRHDQFAAFVRDRSFRHGTHLLGPYGEPLTREQLGARQSARGTWRCPLFSSPKTALFRLVRNMRCGYGARACLHSVRNGQGRPLRDAFGALVRRSYMATPSDFTRVVAETEPVIQWGLLYASCVQQHVEGALYELGFAAPGGGAMGVWQAGYHAACIDNSPSLSDPFEWFHTRLPELYPGSPVIRFQRGDAVVAADRARAVEAHPAGSLVVAVFDSPSCKIYSTASAVGGKRRDLASQARVAGAGKHENLTEVIAACHERWLRNKIVYIVENVVGGHPVLPEGVICTVYDGIMLGVPSQDRHRYYHPREFVLYLDAPLIDGGRWLRDHTCAGFRLLPPLHPHGTPIQPQCCKGQVYTMHNTSHPGVDLEVIAKDLGFHPEHVKSFPRLCDALPPRNALHTVAIQSIWIANAQLGVPAVSYDKARSDTRLAGWLCRVLAQGGSESLPLPVTLAAVILTPHNLPGCIVLERRRSGAVCVPRVTLGPFGDLHANVASSLAAQYGVPLVEASRLSFVCDFLPTILFHSSSLGCGDANAIQKVTLSPDGFVAGGGGGQGGALDNEDEDDEEQAGDNDVVAFVAVSFEEYLRFLASPRGGGSFDLAAVAAILQQEELLPRGCRQGANGVQLELQLHSQGQHRSAVEVHSTDSRRISRFLEGQADKGTLPGFAEAATASPVVVEEDPVVAEHAISAALSFNLSVHQVAQRETTTAPIFAAVSGTPEERRKVYLEKRAKFGKLDKLPTTPSASRSGGGGFKPSDIVIQAVGAVVLFEGRVLTTPHVSDQQFIFTGPRRVGRPALDDVLAALEPVFGGFTQFSDITSQVAASVLHNPNGVRAHIVTSSRNETGQLQSMSIASRRVEFALWHFELPKDFAWDQLQTQMPRRSTFTAGPGRHYEVELFAPRLEEGLSQRVRSSGLAGKDSQRHLPPRPGTSGPWPVSSLGVLVSWAPQELVEQYASVKGRLSFAAAVGALLRQHLEVSAISALAAEASQLPDIHATTLSYLLPDSIFPLVYVTVPQDLHGRGRGGGRGRGKGVAQGGKGGRGRGGGKGGAMPPVLSDTSQQQLTAALALIQQRRREAAADVSDQDVCSSDGSSSISTEDEDERATPELDHDNLQLRRQLSTRQQPALWPSISESAERILARQLTGTAPDHHLRKWIELYFDRAPESFEALRDGFKTVELRVLLGAYRLVRKGWLLCCREGAQSPALWLIVKAVHTYPSAAEAARAHGRRLFPHLPQDPSDAQVEWFAYSLNAQTQARSQRARTDDHLEANARRTAERWLSRIGMKQFVVCWEVSILPPSALLPSRSLCAGQGHREAFDVSDLSLRDFFRRALVASARRLLRRAAVLDEWGSLVDDLSGRVREDRTRIAFERLSASRLRGSRLIAFRRLARRWKTTSSRAKASALLAKLSSRDADPRFNEPLYRVWQRLALRWSTEYRRARGRRSKGDFFLFRIARKLYQKQLRATLASRSDWAWLRFRQLAGKLRAVKKQDDLLVAVSTLTSEGQRQLGDSVKELSETASTTLHSDATGGESEGTSGTSGRPRAPQIPFVSISLQPTAEGVVRATIQPIAVQHIVLDGGILNRCLREAGAQQADFLCLADDCVSHESWGTLRALGTFLPEARTRYTRSRNGTAYSIANEWRTPGTFTMQPPERGRPRVVRLHSQWSSAAPSKHITPSPANRKELTQAPTSDDAANRQLWYSTALQHFKDTLPSSFSGTIAFPHSDFRDFSSAASLRSLASCLPRARILVVRSGRESIDEQLERARAQVHITSESARYFIKHSSTSAKTNRLALALADAVERRLLAQLDEAYVTQDTSELEEQLNEHLYQTAPIEAKDQRQARVARKAVRLDNELTDERYREQLLSSLGSGELSRDQLENIRARHARVVGSIQKLKDVPEEDTAATAQESATVANVLPAAAPPCGHVRSTPPDGVLPRVGAARVRVTSAKGRRTPCRLLDAYLYDESAAEAIRIPLGANIFDGGAGTCLFGEDGEFGAAAVLAKYPDAITRVTPLPSSVRRIQGVVAASTVLYWVSFSLALGGCIVDFEDVPVLRGFSGLLLGNDFIGEGRATVSYGESVGTVVLHDDSHKPISAPVRFAYTEGVKSDWQDAITAGVIKTDSTTAFVARAEAAAEATVPRAQVRLQPSKDGGVKLNILPSIPLDRSRYALEEVAPVAFNPTSCVAPAWSETWIQLRVPNSITKDKPIALVPLEDREQYGDLGVLVKPCFQIPKDGKVWAQVLNAGRRDISIPALAPVARFLIDPKVSTLEVEYDADEALQRIHVGPEDTEDLIKCKQMISKRLSLFRSKLGYCHVAPHHITTDGTRRPPAAPARVRPPVEEAALEDMVNKLRKQDIVEPSDPTEFNALPLVLHKPDGSLRPAIDYRGLNAISDRQSYPLPNVEANIASLGRANWFTTLDLLQGFLQIELTPESKHKTTFTVKGRQWQYKRMPMGLASSPSAFMRVVDAALAGLPPGIAFAYV